MGMPSATGTIRACWDVCNENHRPQEFMVDTNVAVTMSYAGMVETVRAGLNPMVRCPGNFHGGDPCPPGDLCTPRFRLRSDLPEGRGICIIDASEAEGRSCADMC